MAQIGVGELGVQVPGVDAHAQVDVTFADLDQVDARVELARKAVGVVAGDHHVGRILDQRIGLEAAAASAKAQRPDDANNLDGVRARTIL